MPRQPGKKRGGIISIVRFLVITNKSSPMFSMESINCHLVKRKTSPQLGKHIGKLLDSTLVTFVILSYFFFLLFFFFFFKIFGLFNAPSLLGTVK